jgi:hypothetical protein
MSDDNVRAFPLSPDAILQAILRAADLFPKPSPPVDLELTLWDDVVRMRLGSQIYPSSGPPRMATVEEAIDAANKIVAARHAFANR